MSQSVSSVLTINDIEELNDDVFEGAVAAPDEYVDPAGPRPLDEGTYDARIIKIAKDGDDEGNWRDPRYPAIQVDFEIASGEKMGRKANFIKVSSRLWMRKKGTIESKSSELGDLIRAFDPRFEWQQITQALRFLLEQQDRGVVGKFRFGWKAFDSEYFNMQGGPSMTDGTPEKRDLYKKAGIKGQRHFDADGTVIGPSGKQLKARLILLQAVPAKNVGA